MIGIIRLIVVTYIMMTFATIQLSVIVIFYRLRLHPDEA